jgi:hypothetical protein
MAGRDITEGRATRAIAVDVGVVASGSIWQNTESAYDVAIGGKPFFYAISNERPYIRQTAPYRKEQFDNSAEPGEQSLTGWWIRSQSSFHNGDGIIFYDTTAGEEEVANRFADSKGVNVWTKGEVTLLKNSTPIGYSPDALASNGRSNQFFNTIEWTDSGTKYEGILYVDNFILAKVDEAGTVTNFQALDPTVDNQVYAATTDGELAYWITNVVSGGGSKLTMYKKSLNLTSATSATQMLQVNGIDVTNAVLEYTKERIVAAINNKIYEIAPTATALPTAVYTHPSTTHVWSSITSSGPAIYVAGWNGLISTIVKFTLSTAGVMPTLTTAITAAEMPIGEQVYKIKYYLGYLIIGTSKGVRIATVSDQDGSITYGQLIFETTQPVFDFAVRDKFIWCASGTTDGFSGLIRIDLSAEIGPLVFAYANDLYSADDLTSIFPTTALGFLGNTDRLLWVNAANMENTITNKELTDDVATLTTGTAHGYKVGDVIFVSGVGAPFDGTPTITGAKIITAVPSDTTFSYTQAATNVASTAVSPVGAVIRGGTGYIESATDLIPNGYLTTGFIRYNTLEPKNFKRLIGRGDFAFGSMALEIVDRNGVEYDLISYDASVPAVEVTTNTPATAQEYVAYKFLLFRDGDDNTKGPVFKGYQAKATIATPRQRVIRFPVFNYDTETDRYNVVTGYEGRAQDRLLELENVEEDGDVLTWQDFTTGESRQVVIEQISFSRETPPDKRFSGFGGVITMTIRTV